MQSGNNEEAKEIKTHRKPILTKVELRLGLFSSYLAIFLTQARELKGFILI